MLPGLYTVNAPMPVKNALMNVPGMKMSIAKHVSRYAQNVPSFVLKQVLHLNINKLIFYIVDHHLLLY